MSQMGFAVGTVKTSSLLARNLELREMRLKNFSDLL